MTVTQAPLAPPRRPTSRRRGRAAAPMAGRAALVLLLAMAVIGLLLVTDTFKLAEPPPPTRTLSGCAHQDRGGGTATGGPIAQRTSADLVALGTVDSTSALIDIPEAGSPTSQYIVVTYRLEQAFRNTIDCRNSVQVTNRVERGRPPSTDDAPLRGSRVLFFARAAASGNFRFITHAAPPVVVGAAASVDEIAPDNPPPPPSDTETPAEAPSGGLLLKAEVARGTSAFLTSSSNLEVPVRLTLVNSSSEAIDVRGLGPTQWRLQLSDNQDHTWTYAAAADPTEFPPSLPPSAQVQTELVTRPGPESIPAGTYRMELRLETAGEPVLAGDAGVSVKCVAGCVQGG